MADTGHLGREKTGQKKGHAASGARWTARRGVLQEKLTAGGFFRGGCRGRGLLCEGTTDISMIRGMRRIIFPPGSAKKAGSVSFQESIPERGCPGNCGEGLGGRCVPWNSRMRGRCSVRHCGEKVCAGNRAGRKTDAQIVRISCQKRLPAGRTHITVRFCEGRVRTSRASYGK